MKNVAFMSFLNVNQSTSNIDNTKLSLDKQVIERLVFKFTLDLDYNL